MKNKAEVHSDGGNVYVVYTVQATSSRKALLTTLTFGLTLVYAWFWWEIEHYHLKKLFIPTILASVVFVIIPWRYWLWNFFGKEKLIINAQTLSHAYDYKIVRMHRNTIPHRKLTTAYEHCRTFNNEEYGYLRFLSHNDKTNQHEEIYQTGVAVSKNDLAKIQEMVGGVVNV